MPVYKNTRFDVRPEAVDLCVDAARGLVEHVRQNESGTRLYVSMQDAVHPTRFTHFMIFEDAAAEQAHRASPEAKRFTETITPYVVGGIQSRDLKAVAST